jgi:ferredoxin
LLFADKRLCLTPIIQPVVCVAENIKPKTGDSDMGKKVVIDTDECIGCESCVELCSEVFAFNEAEEKAQVIMPEGGPEDCIEEAMETCPVECIHWEED